MREEGKKGGSFFDWERRFFDRLEEKHKGIEEESNCNQGWPGMLLITLEILTHIRFLRVFVYEYLMYCWLMWTKRATSCFIDIGCSLMLSRICLWSFPLAWAHWKITRCGFILFWSRMFVLPLFPLFSIILVFAFLPTRHMAINPSYLCDSKAWAYSYEFQQRNQTLQNSGIAITIWDLERIVQGAC